MVTHLETTLAPRSAPESRKLTWLVERRTLAPMVRVVKHSKAVKPTGMYEVVLDEIVDLIEIGRRRAARMVNATITAVYWSIGRRIVIEEQRGARRAEYGEELIEQLSRRLTARFGRGFGPVNLWQMRAFYLTYREILQTASEESRDGRGGPILQTASEELANGAGDRIPQTASGESDLAAVSTKLPLPWSHYVKLLSVKNDLARRFYETEALRGGWTVRQLDRQIQSQFYERTLLSRNKRAMLAGGQVRRPEDEVTPEDGSRIRSCWSSSASRTSTPRAIWRKRWFAIWSRS